MRFTLALLPSILGMAFAAPAPEAKAGVAARQITTVGLTFYGADNDAKYSISAPADGSTFTISTRLHFNFPGFCCRHFLSSGLTTHLLPFLPTLFPYPPSLLKIPSKTLHALSQAFSSYKPTPQFTSLPIPHTILPYPFVCSRFVSSILHLPATNLSH